MFGSYNDTFICFIQITTFTVIVSAGTSRSDSTVATVREKLMENEFFSRSGKNQGILWMVREKWKGLGVSGKSQGI